MGNLNIGSYKSFQLAINKDDYWDFYLHRNDSNYSGIDTISDENLIAYIDISNEKCCSNGYIQGLEGYEWKDSINQQSVLNNFGYTGVDNGRILMKKDRITNEDFIKIYTQSQYKLPNHNVLELYPVSGSTALFEYPSEVEHGLLKLNGGFYQGFFKTQCNEYQILPDTLAQGDEWNFQFVLNKCEFEKQEIKILNNKYPQNKGIFFYIGTRSENKWDYLYNDDDECFAVSYDDYIEDAHIEKKDYKIDNFIDVELEYVNQSNQKTRLNNCSKAMQNGEKCEEITTNLFDDDYVDYMEENVTFDTDYIANDIDISDFNYETAEGFELKVNNQYYFDTDNKFLLFNRTKTGLTINNYDDENHIRYVGVENGFQGNLFLLMNRTKNGFTINNIDEYRNSFKKEYNVYDDIYLNAFALRITDEGKIGYRFLIKDCEEEGKNKVKVKEGYSKENIIKNNEWYSINVKMIGYATTMKLYFYVNGKLVFVTDYLPKLNLRHLNDLYEKQEGVPFSISLGGGTQGLAETILPNYMLNPYRTYPIEENFAGSFIGYIKSFKFFNENLTYSAIMNNAKNDLNNIYNK